MVKVKAYELRKSDDAALLKKLEELKTELSQLRIAKVTGGAPAKLSKIKVTRKAIARVLTVITEKKRNALREQYKNKKLKPLDLRPRLTRKLRRALTKDEKKAVQLRILKRKLNFPPRSFTVAKLD